MVFSEPIISIDFDRMSEIIVAGSENELRMVDLLHGVLLRKLLINNYHPDLLFQHCFFARHADDVLYSLVKDPEGGNTHLIKWNLSNAETIERKIPLHNFPITAICNSELDDSIGIGTSDGIIKIVDSKDMSIRCEKEQHCFCVNDVAMIEDNSSLASVGADGMFGKLDGKAPEKKTNALLVAAGVFFSFIAYVVIAFIL